MPLEETFEALNQLVEQGKVRIGVSNWPGPDGAGAGPVQEHPGHEPGAHYNLVVREPEDSGVLQFCQERDILLTAYSPLRDGVLQHDMVRRVAEKHGATPAQVALAWLIGKDHVVTIPQSHKVEHLRENLGARDLALSAEDVSTLDRLASGTMQVGR